MEQHYKFSDSLFLEKFEDCTFPPDLFTHEAHLRLAWINLNKYGTKKAIKNVCDQIERFDKVNGDGTKYNKTITVASIYIMKHFMKQSAANNFETLLKEFPKLKHNFLDLIRAHYEIDIFTEEIAKKQYLRPDKISF
ncbi:hypothetical protein [Abyssalbus ytuae]|uniref:Uncharacterized protein n=1 Tax=Abyssalbus ytuae TaxID=2926907 RepID=A0A9E6ZMK8_9FLAO|nr:hypothetical protein [Abyssalbus ytuae]UOB17449.1 hypothetical protein MQE35_17150 [Abyssalbus ytuae]